MEEFPFYCDHCKSLGHLKAECHVLHPHLNTAQVLVSDNVLLDDCGDGSGIPIDNVTVGLAQAIELNILPMPIPVAQANATDGGLLVSNADFNNNSVEEASGEVPFASLGAITLVPVNDLEVDGENIDNEIINVGSSFEHVVEVLACSPFKEYVDNEKLVNVPISVVSAKSFQAHLNSNVGTSLMVDTDWLDITPNSHCSVGEKELVDSGTSFNDLYGLNVSSDSWKDVILGGKRHKRKKKK
ncbi:hypothetical protein M5K25_016891 [Dendrobium thyrsiflorum]|uniref:Uncharacterized protein n=1 Tax=Dendrobium thyrsiflorum TaxID=117978 RepID=A0ABD0ULP4_DENTH